MYIAPGKGKKPQMTKFLSQYRAFFVTSIIFVKFHHDTPDSKGTRDQNPFLYIGAGADNSSGVNFEHHRKILSLSTFAVSFRGTALNSDFI